MLEGPFVDGTVPQIISVIRDEEDFGDYQCFIFPFLVANNVFILILPNW